MRFQSIALLAAGVLLAAASPAFAGGPNGGPNGDGNGGPGGGDPPGVAAPGPMAGAGLGYLVLAGGYYVVRRWRKQNTAQ